APAPAAASQGPAPAGSAAARSTAAAAAPASAAPASAAPIRVVCASDADCPDETICENATCRRIEQRINVFYLYYQEGAFREILGLYWSKRGPSGYNVVVPFYWSYFTPKSRSRIVAPFYWHFEDDTAQRTSTVIVPGLPISWSQQPDARSFGIWPLFYRSTKFGWAAPLLGSFKIADPDRGRAFGAFAFLYWWQRNPEGAFDLGLPLFVSSRSAASALTYVVPLNFYWRTNDEARTLAIPFFYRHTWKGKKGAAEAAATYTPLGYHTRDGAQSDGSIAWLYWFGRDGVKGKEHDVLFPLLWSFRTRNSGTTILFPLVWDFKEPDSRITVAGPVGHLRDGRGWLTTVFPLWWSGGNSGADPSSPPKSGDKSGDRSGGGIQAQQTKDGQAPEQIQAWRFQLLIPLFFWKESERGTKFTWLAPIGGYHRDDQERSRTLALLPGLFFRRDPQGELDVVTPLFIRRYNSTTDAKTRLLALLLYLRNDPGGTTKVLFPIFWRFTARTGDSTATALLPVFFRRRGPRDTTTAAGVFPLWFYWRQFVGGGWGAGLFPLAFFGQRGDNGHGVIFPFLWRFSDAKGSTTAVLPLFVRKSDRTGGDTAILPLLTFFGGHGGASYQVQFPLFWRFADERARSSMAVTPIGFFGRSPDGWRLGVGPLLPIVWAAGGGPRRHFVLFPLFWHFADDQRDESTTVVGTFLHRRRGGETTDALLPLLYYRRGARPGGTDETSFTFLPFIHYRRDAFTRVLVTPLASSVTGPRRAAGFVGPFLWYRGPNTSAQGVPFLYADVTKKDTGERTRQFGPLFAIDGPDKWARIFLPLFGRYQDSRATDTYVCPTF
ncbi:MAG: hypothetical protein ABUR63_00295, partial [Verrucomicrobiota bacterium]